MAGVPFSSIPWSSATRFEPQEFHVLFLRASGVLYPCPPQVAGVAVHSILMATTAQLVRTQEFWGEGVPLWRAHVCREVEAHSSNARNIQDGDWCWLEVLRMNRWRRGGVDDVGSVVSGIEEPPSEEDIVDVDVRVVQLVFRETFRSLDEVDVCQIFRR